MILDICFWCVQIICFCWHLNEQESRKKMSLTCLCLFELTPFICNFHAVVVWQYLLFFFMHVFQGSHASWHLLKVWEF